MEFVKGLFSVMFIYAILWGIFQWGYMSGADAEMYSRSHANAKLQQCQGIIAGNMYEVGK